MILEIDERGVKNCYDFYIGIDNNGCDLAPAPRPSLV